MEHWFIYYKLPASQLFQALTVLQQMVQQVERATGTRARLMMRKDEANHSPTFEQTEFVTVMEVYSGVTDGAAFAGVLQQALMGIALPTAAREARRIERFIEAS